MCEPRAAKDLTLPRSQKSFTAGASQHNIIAILLTQFTNIYRFWEKDRRDSVNGLFCGGVRQPNKIESLYT